MRQISLTVYFATVFILLYEIAKPLLVALLVLALVSPLFVAVPAVASEAKIGDGREGGNLLIDLLWWLRRDGWQGWANLFEFGGCDCDETVGGGGGGGGAG